ncbi:MAG TPA: serine hydrolase domain-containing protein [Puia sp.]|nr:serine hydrolase domain-containing protein [Puia sp.]
MKKMLPFSFATTFLAVGCLLTVHAQHISGSAKTNEYIRLMMLRKHIPGLSVAVLKEGKILKMQGYGLANIETHLAASSQSVYKIGSLSKQFIATAVMLLHQDGKINLDAPIDKYLDSLPLAWQDITVRNLLTHTSGLVRDVPDFDPLKIRPLNQDIESIYSLPLDFAPGTKWDYSNMNYDILGAIIGKVTATDWADWISKHIFELSGMSQTRKASMKDVIQNRASGYNRRSEGWENADIWLALEPSGAFLSSISDMAKWEKILCSGQLLTADSKKQMWTAMKLNNGDKVHYGFGWFIDSVNGHIRIHHSGAVPGFKSDFERFPDDKLSVIVLTNIGSANAERMAQNIAGFFMPALKPLPARALPDKEPEITAIVKSFISRLQQQSAIDTGTLSAQLAKAYNKDRTRTLANAISGKIYSTTLIERREKNGRRTYRYRLDYGYDYIDLIMQFDAENKINGYGIDD